MTSKFKTFQQLRDDTYQRLPWWAKLIGGQQSATDLSLVDISEKLEKELGNKKGHPLVFGDDTPFADTVDLRPAGDFNVRMDKDAIKQLASAVVKSYKLKLPHYSDRGIMVDEKFRPIYTTTGGADYIDTRALGAKEPPKSKAEVSALIDLAKKRAKYLIGIRGAELLQE